MNRRLTSVASAEQFFQELDEYFSRQLTPEEAGAVRFFARQFFERYPLEELAGRHLSDVGGAVYQWWRFIQVFNRDTPKIRAFNPSLDEDGWICPCTVLVVLQRDMPFLVDSIRIELNRRNISIHSIKSTVIHTTRYSSAKLIELLPDRLDTSPDDLQPPNLHAPDYPKPHAAQCQQEACSAYE